MIIIEIKKMGAKGLAIRPFVLIGNKNHKCTIVHEKKHIEQQKYPFPFNSLWLLRWFFSRRFRHRVEKEAFREELRCLLRRGITPSRKYYYDMLIERRDIFSYKMPEKEANDLLDEEGIYK